MKAFFFALAIIGLAAAVTIEEQWEAFKIKFNRNFTAAEDAERFEIFKAKVVEIAAHNAQLQNGEVSYEMGVNEFSDRKSEELNGLHGGLIVPHIKPNAGDEDVWDEDTVDAPIMSNPDEKKITIVSNPEKSIEDQWAEYKNTHNRNFAAKEETLRFNLFKDTLKMIKEHNAKYAKGEVSFSMALNQFSDRTKEELKQSGLLPVA